MSETTAVLDPRPTGAVPSPAVRSPRRSVLAAALVAVSAALLAFALVDPGVSIPVLGVGYASATVAVWLLLVAHPRRARVAAAARGVLVLGLLAGAGNAFLLATAIAKP